MAFETPQSTNEAILQNMLGASNEIKPPQSRVEKLLQELSGQMPEANPSEGTTTGTLERLKIGDDIYSVEGGGSGTSDYDALNNKPQIAGTTLSGNKSLADLGIASATTVSGILDGASIDSFADVETALAGKQDTLTFDNTPTENSTNPVKSGGIYSALAGKADTGIVADDFDSTASYVIGNYCIENGKLYRFKANHSGAWSASDVDEIQITGELATLKSGLTPEEKFCVVNSEVVEDNNRVVIYKVGRVVFVTMSYAPKSGTIVSGAIIFSQLPTPIQAWQIFDGISQLILDTDGSLKFWYPSDTTIGRRDFTFSYVTAS